MGLSDDILHRMKSVGVLALASLLVCCLGFAGDAQTPDPAKFTVYGEGLGACGEWRDGKRNTYLYAQNRAWLTGFVSGYGYAGQKLRLTDAGGIAIFVDDYCQAHPSETIEHAAEAFVHALASAR
jgi:hypothetical protein